MKNNLPMHRLLPSLFLALGFSALGPTQPLIAAITNVSIIDFAFSPPSVTINVNDQVRWAWVGSAPHSSTSDTGLWDSGINDMGSTFTNTFGAAGNFPYHCRVHLSMRAAVTVEGGDTGPTITTQPQSRTVPAGTNVTFTVSATGSPPLSYQWQFNGTPIPDATATSLMLANVQLLNAGSYSVAVTNSFGMTVSSDAVLTVITVKGNYNGLFFDPNDVTFQSSGSFSLATTGTGKFTGKLQMAGRRLSFAGQFDSGGNATNNITRPNQSPLVVTLHLDLADADRITGTVSDGTFTVPLAGDRAVFDGRQKLAPQAGQYTMIIPGAVGSSSLPGGDSPAAVTVDKTGKIRLAGSLADATKISQTTSVSKNGDWPFYVPLYGNLGAIIGWISFSSASTNDLSGDVVWLKPALAKAKFYPAGFTLATTALGFQYHPPPAGTGVLNFTNGSIIFSGADLGESITNLITIDARNHLINQSSNRLAVAFKPSSGTFTGRVTVPNTTQSLFFNGVLLQPTEVGQGYFLGTTQSGQLLLTPQP